MNEQIFICVSVCQGTVLCHTSVIYISIIKSVQTNKKINLFYFFYHLLLIPQQVLSGLTQVFPQYQDVIDFGMNIQ
jgi:hypothetical protein